MLPFRGEERCVVSYSHDPEGLWPQLQASVTAAVSPLRHVLLATRFGDVPTRGIPRWGIPQGNEVAAQVVLQFKPGDGTAGADAAIDTANAFANPYCHLGFVRHDANDAAKEELLAWAAERAERREQHLLVVVGASSGGTRLLSRALSFTSGEDVLTKLSKLGAATCRLDAPAPSANQMEEFGNSLQECLRVSLSARVEAFLEELEAHEAAAEAEAGTPAETGSFYRYFSLKEGLALLYQQTGMPSLALQIYDELEEEFDALCSDHSADMSGPPLLGGVEGAPVGTSAAKAAALVEAAVESAADQVLEDLLDGTARNYREDVRSGELGRVEMLQYIWWRRWQIILETVGVGSGKDLNDALEVASGAIEKITAILRDPQNRVAHFGEDVGAVAATKLPEGYADRWAVCATLAAGAQIAAQLHGGLGPEAYRLVQPTLPLALGQLGSLYVAAHPLALRLTDPGQTRTVITQDRSEELSTEEYTLHPEGEGTPAEMVAEASQSPRAAAALGRALLRSALAAMRGAGRKRSALKLARELAQMYCADGRHADASTLLNQQCGTHGCEQLAGWPMLRCDILRLLAVCCRNAAAAATALGGDNSNLSRELQKLVTCLVALLGIDVVVSEAESAAIRAELVELSGSGPGGGGGGSNSTSAGAPIDVDMDSSTLQVLLKAPISPAQQVIRSADGSVTIQLGRLALCCASPGALSAEAEAEAVALSAATGRRLSIGRNTPAVAAALMQTRSSGTEQEGSSSGDEKRTGGDTATVADSENGKRLQDEVRAVVVNISTRSERTFLLGRPNSGSPGGTGPTVGALRAAIKATGDFGGSGPADAHAQTQTQQDCSSFELVVGTGTPLADDALLVQAALRGVILLIPGK
jgi:hypothetical protein